tara:strand:- start:3105 stop:3677 length:573 start_codon:yes stop_codon:yes gene_type:complete
MAGKLRQIAGKPKKDRYRATSIEKFQTQFANELLDKLNPQIRSVIGKIRDYADQNFVAEGEGIGNFDAMKIAKTIPGPVGFGIQTGIGVGNILSRTSNVNNSADLMIGKLANMSTSGTKGEIKSRDANLMALKGQMGEFDTLTKGTMASTKLATNDLLSEASAQLKRDTAPMALFKPALEFTGYQISKDS